MYICAGEIEQFSFAMPVGIGLVGAASNLTKICIENKPESLIFVGTAGSYGKEKIFAIRESTTATNIENSFLLGDSYSPIPSIAESLGNVSRETIVNSSSYITTSKKLSEKYLEKNINLESMEFYAVLYVAKKFNIPAKGIFIVTNYCDEHAHRDFMNNRKEAMDQIEIYIKENR